MKERNKTKQFGGRSVDDKFIRNGASGISGKDVEGLLGQEEKLMETSESGVLKKYLDDIMTLFSMVRDYVIGAYREIPWATIASATFALLYVINPFDLVPDFIPVVGQLDDAAVLCLCLAMVGTDINRYKQWKNQNETTVNI